MESIERRLSQSFVQIKEILGFGPKQVKRCIVLEDEALQNLRANVKSNIVQTSQYSALTFLPVNLYQQMSKAANIYFVMITVLQTIKVISISNGEPTMLPPLIFVVLTSMCKDAYEDWQRHREDSVENNAIGNRFNKQTNRFEKVRWGEIQVGDFVKVEQDNFFPADIVVVHSTEAEGVCYVETKNLDGETNLKNKQVPKPLWSTFANAETSIKNFEATFNIEGPNNLIYKFDGSMDIKQKNQLIVNPGNITQIPLSAENLLLRGMSLRNTESVIGVVVYTGSETKIQMNSSKPVYKISKMMAVTNSAIFYIFMLQVIFSFSGAFICASWTFDNEENSYLMLSEGNDSPIKADLIYVILTMTGSWILIFCNFVPISLLVTLEMIKFFQGAFMDMDVEMFDADQDFAMRAQCTAINEELGQIEYIFSDKTGTLTCNVMQFKKFSSKAVSFDVSAKEIIEQDNSFVTNPNGLVFRSKPELDTILKDKYNKEYQGLYDILLFLSVCHTVVIDKNKGVYNAASPDEQALVEGARDQGFEFIGREPNNVLVVKDPAGYKLRYRVLNTLEFNSTRKRMSLIVENQQTGYIELLSKGADSIMEKLLKRGDAATEKQLEQTKAYIDAYSKEGLRTLLVAKKDISQREYDAWNAKFQAACLTLENREENVMKVSAEIETNLTLVGSTAIEDRLQDDVKETIVSIRAAGIKLWVLTGDKIETAVQIGYSTGLLDEEMVIHVCDATDFGSICRQLAKISDDLHQIRVDPQIPYSQRASQQVDGVGNKKAQQNALIVSGDTLTIIQNSNRGLLELLLENAQNMEVVICCRVSPKQKGDIVSVMRMRNPNKVTMAIGDGANDCPMIIRAHVGIGIAGKEGMQAARTADFAIGKFCFLKRLMFLHGREAYRRNGDTVLYMFYKNVLYTIVQYMFGYYSIFSGQAMYEKWIYTLYNVTFTGLHIIWYALFDFQFEKEVFMQNPVLYSIGMRDLVFNMKEFWIWFIYANAQAFMILILAFVLPEEKPTSEGKIFSFWAGGHHVLMNCVLLSNLIILKMHNTINILNVLIITAQIAAYFVLLWYFSEGLQTSVYYSFMEEFRSSPVAWLGCFLIVSSLWTLDYMLQALRLCSQRCCRRSDEVEIEDLIDSRRKQVQEEYAPSLSVVQLFEKQ